MENLEQAQTGDLIGFSPQDKKDFIGIHVGVISLEDGEIHVLHNAKHEGAARVQKIDDILKHAKHQKIAWIKRPIVEDPTLRNPTVLTLLGFEMLIK